MSKKNFYYQNRYFISGVKYETLLENNKELMSENLTTIIKNYNLDSNINWRFKKTTDETKGSLQFDLSEINLANNISATPIWKTVDPKIIEITKTLINSGLDDLEVGKKLHINLLKEGYEMINNELVKNENMEVASFDVVSDIGNYDTKAKCGENKITITSKIYKGSLADIPGLEWIDYNSKKIYIGTENGEYISEYDKVKKFNDVKCQILYAIDKAVNSDEDIYEVNLGYLLPIAQTSRAESIINSLKGQTFEFETQNGSKIITIKNVTIIPEGYASTRLFSENEKMIDYLDNDLLMLDCGSRTINAISFSDYNIQNADTLSCGSFDLYTIIQNDLKNNKRKDKSIERIAYLYEKGKLKVEDNLLIDYLKKIEDALKSYSSDLEDYDNIVITGGVAKLLEKNKLSDEVTLLDKLIEILGIDKEKVHVLENPTETNIDGAMLLLKDVGEVA
ncbi:ParM/StbA family protein [Clostridium tagluense]|uniref:ParM/StbA family protein n=1 Tax=Clostridium tagluense TaxID=360422 RepID=UPI001CF4B306|nr:ParM/StbA family protein [Clostridium tagluense]MCB2297068.1 ParM/StbA family protein [Clostridium tagluense]